jgi:HlyD family secretion protein
LRKRYIYRLLGLLLAGLILYLLYPRANLIAIEVDMAEKGLVEKTVSNTRAGTIVACERAQMSPGTGGQIARLSVREGDKVKAGQLLLELWNEDLRAAIQLAESELKASQDNKIAACLHAEVAQRDADRQTALSKKGAASKGALDKTVTEAKASQADCRAAQASVEVAEARLGVSRANLARTRLVAPFSGVVAQLNGNTGEYVTPSPPGIATRPVIDLIGSSCFHVNAPIDEVDAARIKLGMPVRITLDAFNERIFEGRVRRIAPFVLDLEREARTVSVEVDFVTPEDLLVLLVGYSTDVEIILETRPDTLRIPTRSVQENDSVFIFDPEKEVIISRKIATGIANWEYTEVIDGLAAGELVVTSTDLDGIVDGAEAAITENTQ